MKPFRAHLVEQEEDFEYKLCSVENIHGKEILDRIRLALGRYGLISLKTAGIQTQVINASDHQFDEYPFLPVYVCKVVLSNQLSSNPVVQSISVFTNIRSDKLKFFDMKDKIVMDGPDAEQHAYPVEVDSKIAQDEVGQLRANALVSDMMLDIANRREAGTYQRDVYEGAVASHKEVKQIIGRPVRRGFYIVEQFNNGLGSIVGPFRKCPDNYGYINTIVKAHVLNEDSNDGIDDYDVQYAPADHQNDPDDAGNRSRGVPMEVVLVDQDKGSEHRVVVRANSDDAARLRAIEIMAKRTGLPKDTFIPKNPNPVA